MIIDRIQEYARSQIPGFAAGAGIVLALAVVLFGISRPAPVHDTPKASIIPETGAPARVAETKRDGDAILFPLEYDGAGSSTLSVPVDSVPEARAWRHEVWSTSFLYLSDGTAGIFKGYRLEDIEAAAGPWIRSDRLAVPKLHYRSRGRPDFGVGFEITKYSDSPLF